MEKSDFTARVTAVQDDLVTIETIATDTGPGPLKKNEVVYICPTRTEEDRQEKLKAEVLRIHGNSAEAQVFENTTGVAVGDPVQQTNQMLSVSLGPGLLGQVYDGLQNPLETLASEFGYFLPRGVEAAPLDTHQKWSFVPTVRAGSRLVAGDVIGTVQEGRYTHKIMIPFDEQGTVEVTWIQEGTVTIEDPVARIRMASGKDKALTLVQKWPVRRPLPEALLDRRIAARLYPSEPLITTMRLIDTFFPIARGGYGLYSGTLRSRQNGTAEPDLPLFIGGYRHCRRLRGTGRRGRRNHHRIPENDRPQVRWTIDGPHHYHLQHLIDAGRGA